VQFARRRSDVDIGVDVHAKFFEVSRAIRLAREIEPIALFGLKSLSGPKTSTPWPSAAINIPLASGEGQLHEV
jgi:hypothetical protein